MSRKSALLVLLTILVVALLGGFVLTFVLFYAVLFLLASSYLWVYLNARQLDIRVEGLAEKYEAGQFLEERVTVHNRGRLPRLSVMVSEKSDLPGHNNSRAVTVPGRGSRSWQNVTPCHLRGYFTLGPFEVTSEDPFGIFRQTRTCGTPEHILVYPASVELPGFQLFPFHEQGPKLSSQATHRITPNAAWVRDYSPGDSLSRIHWRSTARVGKLMVKEFDPDLSDEVWIALDLNRGTPTGAGKESALEYGITIAASLARKYLEAGTRLGLLAYGDKPYRIPADNGANHVWRIMESLALMKAEGSQTLAQVLHRERELFGSHTHLVIITYQTDPDLKATLHRSTRGGKATLILIDRTSFEDGPHPPSSPEAQLSGNTESIYVV
ncbi:MAG: DUF58 domain-containing protein, partial [Dehalococcoidia bacterium]|nr:DUF58 domain-containing protein [Dehalococcoidia bacterium]